MSETLTNNEKANVIVLYVSGIMKEVVDFPETEEMKISTPDGEHVVLTFISYERDELGMPREKIISPDLWIPLNVALSENPRLELIRILSAFVKEMSH